MFSFRFVLLSFFLLLVSSAFALEHKVIPWIQTPVLDGVLDEAAWQQAWQGELVEMESGGTPAQRTQVMLGRNSTHLFAAYKCWEPYTNKIKCQFTLPEERDSNIFNDDCVELFIDPFGQGSSQLYHFIINSPVFSTTLWPATQILTARCKLPVKSKSYSGKWSWQSLSLT